MLNPIRSRLLSSTNPSRPGASVSARMGDNCLHSNRFQQQVGIDAMVKRNACHRRTAPDCAFAGVPADTRTLLNGLIRRVHYPDWWTLSQCAPSAIVHTLRLKECGLQLSSATCKSLSTIPFRTADARSARTRERSSSIFAAAPVLRWRGDVNAARVASSSILPRIIIDAPQISSPESPVVRAPFSLLG